MLGVWLVGGTYAFCCTLSVRRSFGSTEERVVASVIVRAIIVPDNSLKVKYVQAWSANRKLCDCW
jgi:hypothetical protein